MINLMQVRLSINPKTFIENAYMCLQFFSRAFNNNARVLFTDPFNQEYTLLEGVSAINLGLSISLGADLVGNLRDDQPDAGAFEYQP